MPCESIFFHQRVKTKLVLIKLSKMHVSDWHVIRDNGESGAISRQDTRKKIFLTKKTRLDSVFGEIAGVFPMEDGYYSINMPS